jgi:hypothetical protein
MGSTGTTRFRRRRRGGVTLTVSPAEAPVLHSLLSELATLVAPDEPDNDDPLAAMVGIGTSAGPYDDPVLARLFPDAYKDDPEAASEFRRYTETSLREHKHADALAALDTLVDPGTERALEPEVVQSWLGALNDLRLALGARLQVQEDWRSQAYGLAPDDPELAALITYDWLSMLQEQLVGCLG